MLYWSIKKFKGASEQFLRIKVNIYCYFAILILHKITLQDGQNPAIAKKEIGPISLEFDIPMFNASNVQIRYTPPLLCLSKLFTDFCELWKETNRISRTDGFDISLYQRVISTAYGDIRMNKNCIIIILYFNTSRSSSSKIHA